MCVPQSNVFMHSENAIGNPTSLSDGHDTDAIDDLINRDDFTKQTILGMGLICIATLILGLVFMFVSISRSFNLRHSVCPKNSKSNKSMFWPLV